jgi:hypothetical protein
MRNRSQREGCDESRVGDQPSDLVGSIKYFSGMGGPAGCLHVATSQSRALHAVRGVDAAIYDPCRPRQATARPLCKITPHSCKSSLTGRPHDAVRDAELDCSLWGRFT